MLPYFFFTHLLIKKSLLWKCKEETVEKIDTFLVFFFLSYFLQKLESHLVRISCEFGKFFSKTPLSLLVSVSYKDFSYLSVNLLPYQLFPLGNLSLFKILCINIKTTCP